MKKRFIPSGNKIIDDFIRYTQVNLARSEGKLKFVPYNQFKNIEFIAEGGFSKIYKATWFNRTVVLKKLNNSKNITSKELNELKIFYNYYTKWKTQFEKYRVKYKRDKISQDTYKTRHNYISEYFGITQDLKTQDFMIIMPYYSKGDLIRYISNNFYNIKWFDKLSNLVTIAIGLVNIHRLDIIHRDLHSGNIFFDSCAYIGDLGISKSATESTDNNENYGIIPYMAPEIFQGKKYIKDSDIYSFGMIMWEFMTGRRPFWDRNHDIYLIIEISDGLRPPIVTNAPEGFIELMKECWDSNPDKRPTADDIYIRIGEMYENERKSFYEYNNPTEIIESSDIGPVTTNHLGAIYKSRPLSGMINSAMSLRSLRSQSVNLEKVKRNFEDNNDEGQSIKRKKLFENENNDYFTNEIELDIDIKPLNNNGK
ncbi:Cdc15p [Rhizophagus irregularis DAOM 197198w]|uniref:Cdc15p n=1 Tax=Rhizophagus irregularis (strain DAOM 197198w) TaxID=1432141 RepID=A0A015M0L7_RHIIW|nr:Cdc15p [Rhizophagus irregularis DAOM 197198w]